MSKKEMIAMILAGGQGSRLGVLTANVAKPAVSFGGKYRIIDFPLSNCVNSGIDTVGVLTQYQPFRLNSHIGIGISWDLDNNNGGVYTLPPYATNQDNKWYGGTANAIFQNIHFIDMFDPEYVLILAGDHVYKMDYQEMLDFHKEHEADVTIAARTVEYYEASRFGIVATDANSMATGFEEKPEHPKGNLASMGIYIFSWPLLRELLLQKKEQTDLDFGKHVIPYLIEQKQKVAVYPFNKYWKDVGTLESYWEANHGMVELIPNLNVYDEYWKIYTRAERTEMAYISPEGFVERSIIGESTDVYGGIWESVIGTNVRIGKGSIIRQSIIMSDTVIGENVTIDKGIIAENCRIGDGAVLGCGEERTNEEYPDIYNCGIVTVGEDSVIPPNVRIGKNTAISGVTVPEDYCNHILESGKNIIKDGESE